MPPLLVPQNKLVYSVVARGPVVLAEHSTVSGNAHLLAVRILEKMDPNEDVRVSYSQERYMFHVMVAEGVTLMVVAEEAFGRRIPFSFLEDVRGRFMEAYGESVSEALAYEYNTSFSKVLAERMNFFATDPAADTINRVKGEIMEVKNIMIENIEKVLERGERLDLLVDKTEVLQDSALVFRRDARRMKRTLWWRSARLWVLVAVMLVLLGYFVLAAVCGFTLHKC